ncbi:hypothetical protein BASA81_000884 [Batrachochytrium salamandrivorans]|nr:hypothetical protein BASA81_000884 [Batrachochytrium salamandrivorans]
MGEELTTHQAFWHCMNLVVGLGTLTVPYTLNQLGWFLGLTILASLAALSSLTSKLLCRCVDTLNAGTLVKRKKTYSDLGEAAFGKLGRRAVDVILYVDLVASSALFLVFIATNLDFLFPKWLPSISWWILLVAGGLLPTVFMRLDKLSFLSKLGSYVMILLVLAVVASLFVSTSQDTMNNEYRFARLEIQALGNQVFAFAMHGTILTIFQDMHRPQDAEGMFDRVYLTGFLLKFIVGASGYFLFAQQVSDQITLNLPDARLRFAITLVLTLKNYLTYALPLEPVARVLEQEYQVPTTLARSSLVLVTVFVALLFPHFGLMQSLIGSLCAGCLVLVFPVAFYLQIVPHISERDKLQYQLLLVVSGMLVWLAVLAAIREAAQ